MAAVGSNPCRDGPAMPAGNGMRGWLVPAASATGGSAYAAGGATREQAALAYARCMRSHGVPDFPDPDSNGDFHVGNNSVSSQETAANQVCNHLLNVGQYQAAARACQSLATHAKG